MERQVWILNTSLLGAFPLWGSLLENKWRHLHPLQIIYPQCQRTILVQLEQTVPWPLPYTWPFHKSSMEHNTFSDELCSMFRGRGQGRKQKKHIFSQSEAAVWCRWQITRGIFESFEQWVAFLIRKQERPFAVSAQKQWQASLLLTCNNPSNKADFRSP